MFSWWNILHFSEKVCRVIPHNHTSCHIWFYLQGAFNFMIFSNIPSHYSSKSLMRLANFQLQNTLRLRYLMLTFQKPVWLGGFSAGFSGESICRLWIASSKTSFRTSWRIKFSALANSKPNWMYGCAPMKFPDTSLYSFWFDSCQFISHPCLIEM